MSPTPPCTAAGSPNRQPGRPWTPTSYRRARNTPQRTPQGRSSSRTQTLTRPRSFRNDRFIDSGLSTVDRRTSAERCFQSSTPNRRVTAACRAATRTSGPRLPSSRSRSGYPIAWATARCAGRRERLPQGVDGQCHGLALDEGPSFSIDGGPLYPAVRRASHPRRPHDRRTGRPTNGTAGTARGR